MGGKKKEKRKNRGRRAEGQKIEKQCGHVYLREQATVKEGGLFTKYCLFKNKIKKNTLSVFFSLFHSLAASQRFHCPCLQHLETIRVNNRVLGTGTPASAPVGLHSGEHENTNHWTPCGQLLQTNKSVCLPIFCFPWHHMTLSQWNPAVEKARRFLF